MDYTKLSNSPTRIVTLLAIAGAAFVGGCGNSNHQDQASDPTASNPTDQSTVEAPAAENPDLPGTEQASDTGAGLQTPPSTDDPFAELGVYDLLIGDGQEATPADTVTVHYRGTLRETGEEFDASIGGDPLTLALARFVPGFKQGVEGMKVGGKRVLHIPWSMAYGERGSPPVIPPRADLVFEVELMAVRSPQLPPPPPPPTIPELTTEFEGEPQDLGDGLTVRDIQTGTGDEELGPGATAIVHYRGVLADTGAQFDASYDRGEPAKFKLDPGALIEGFSRGLMGMKAGGKRRIEIPSALGYGTRGNPPSIPADADLIFEVEVLSFINPRKLGTEWLSEETRENGLIVRIIREGDPEAEPVPANGIAVMHAMGALEDGTVFESTFESGQKITVPIEVAGIEGWRLGVAGMRPGEVRQFVVPPELGFGEAGVPQGIPQDASLTFEIELFDWREPKELSTTFVGEPTELEEGITIRDISVGEGPEAGDGQLVAIYYLAELPDGTQVANTFDTGSLDMLQLNGQQPLPGFRKAIVGMKVGGVRRIELAPEHGFGEAGNPPMVPPNSSLVIEVELAAVQ